VENAFPPLLASETPNKGWKAKTRKFVLGRRGWLFSPLFLSFLPLFSVIIRKTQVYIELGANPGPLLAPPKVGGKKEGVFPPLFILCGG